jgi:hypothetical protein
MDIPVFVNIQHHIRCICGWQFGTGVGVNAGMQNRHCFNSDCENSFQQVHPNGYNVHNNCCIEYEDEGIDE